mmetsp:Transcript_96912/g.301691  ORF Transcript_96912/g.301691 Transcript_96912/m.301691 type:complete len:137 (+) Transcript_96912:2-412(+)
MAQAILAQGARPACVPARAPSQEPPALAAMKRCRAALACLALLLAVVQGSRVAGPPRPPDNNACKTTCQRFGMKFLARFWSDFKGVAHPTACCKVCDKVLPAHAHSSLSQLREAPPVAASGPQKAAGAAGVAPVKR